MPFILPDIQERMKAKARARPNYELQNRVTKVLQLIALGGTVYCLILGGFL